MEKEKLTAEQEFAIKMEQALKTFPLEFEAFEGKANALSKLQQPTTVAAKINNAGLAIIDFDAKVRMPKNIESLNSRNEGSIFFLM